ncbi:hypothetical protein HanRHA438_Chr02g0081581 [Helianthus annuus]|nr:hypothetical protein HanRHA438_Chr02g0081581 [Helianthus annuus]
MIAMPMARKMEAASKGATGPIANEPTNRFPNKPATIATSPFPRNIAFENVIDSHCCSKPLYNVTLQSKTLLNNIIMN